MANEHLDTAERVFCDVIERMAFMFADRVEADADSDTVSNGVMVSMTFSGPIKGSVSIAVPGDMCADIAANTLGVEPDAENAKEKGHDALKELLNVVTGNLVPEIAGTEPVFDLSMPELGTLTAESWRALQDEPNTIKFVVDDYPTLLRLEV